MKKQVIIMVLILGMCVFFTTASMGLGNVLEDKHTSHETGVQQRSHRVLAELGLATTCPHCPSMEYYIQQVSGDFEIVSLPCSHYHYTYGYNQDIIDRLFELGMAGYPDSFWDGGYTTVGGHQYNVNALQAAYDACAARSVADVSLELTVLWLGDAEMDYDLSLTNNEAGTYNGHLRVYTLEIISRWNGYDGSPYTNALLNLSYDNDVSVGPGGTWDHSFTWDGDDAGYGDITSDNILVVASVFDQATDYTDETISAYPTTNLPPAISNIQATPSIQIPGGLVNITATVTDDAGLNMVTVNITPPGATTPTGHTMTQGTDDTYYYQTSYSTLGTYDYYVYALDTGGSDITSPTQDFMIWEYNPPLITTIQAITLPGDHVNITCTVTDDTGVDMVTIAITDPVGNIIQASMDPQGDDTYTYEGTFATPGGYLYLISALDTAGNSNTTPSHVLLRQMMSSGWNLITLPLDTSWTAETLGQNISGCSVICRFNATGQSYISHVVNTPHDDFPIQEGVGYFMYVNTPSIFTATGECIPGVDVHLYTKWNLIGWYQESATTAEALGQGIDGCTVVCAFNATDQSYISHVVNTPHNNYAVVWGMGLFVYTNSESDWQGNG